MLRTILFLLYSSCLAYTADIDFNQQIRPLLSEYCFHCHGPDEETREGKLRLDIETGDDGAYRIRKTRHAIFPGEPQKSHIYLRMITDDEDDIMPPLESKKTMKPEEKELIKKWLEQGAKYEAHWSFSKPTKKPQPQIIKKDWVKNSIDHFILAKMEQQNLSPSAPADKRTLVRRLYLDLTGLPPTIKQVDSFVASRSSTAYSDIIDQLMTTPVFAERLTLDWLDVARYADTNGFSIDDHRDTWAWRDWVISAFMKNMSYKDFLTEQIAGDLLPNATDHQKSATGFLRNSMNTHEGGTIAEEYRVQYTVDKLDTVATTFMGLTVKCAQCHDHKFDPISQKHFYELFAYFNNSSEGGKGAANGNSKPFIHLNSELTPADKMKGFHQDRIAELNSFKNLIKDQKERYGYKIGVTIKSIDKEISIINKQLKSGKTSAMIMDSNSKRKTFILDRGQYNKPTTEVSVGVLEGLLAMPAEYPKNRLGLAKWLTHPDHPLTARVAANRIWQLIFNRGLVETSEDFGSQGSVPTHPKLLDFLAVQLQEDNWNIRKLVKFIVMSATYQQSSVVKEQYLEVDPQNKLYTYAPSFRLPAELIRDNALAISGLLNKEIGGPSVYPPQPGGLWSQVSHFGYPGSFTAQTFFPSLGENRYRRSMYTAIKRTALNPSMAGFDAPSRETCSTRRLTTNTPIQALVTLNDPQFVEAAEAFSKKMAATSKDLNGQIIFAFKQALARSPKKDELNTLKKAFHEQLAFYQKNKDLCFKNTPQQAALNAIASIILNLSETLTRN
jgi:hypothetical protein